MENGKWRNGRINCIMDITHGLFLAGIRQTLLVFRAIYLLGVMFFSFLMVKYGTVTVIRMSCRQWARSLRWELILS